MPVCTKPFLQGHQGHKTLDSGCVRQLQSEYIAYVAAKVKLSAAHSG